MTFVVNGFLWTVEFVEPDSLRLVRKDGSRTVAVTDWNLRKIFISSLVYGKFLEKVICHELCHVWSFSYGMHLEPKTEEIIADYIGTYGIDIIEQLDLIIWELKKRRESVI